MNEGNDTQPQSFLERLFEVGAHFGYQRTRRHPSVKPYLFGSKNRIDIIDLSATERLLSEAKEFLAALGRERKVVLLVGTKPEARAAIEAAAFSLEMPYVTNRWVGGTITNFPEIRKRMERYEDLKKKKEAGELGVYTKKERGLLEKEFETLDRNFGGLLTLKNTPAALLVVDPRAESIAVLEANRMGVPVVALLNSDCDASRVAYPVPGNDANPESINFIVNELAAGYRAGRDAGPEKKEEPASA